MATGSQQEKFKPFPFIQTQLSELGIDSGGVIPSISQESWKYTNLSQLANIDFQNSPDICQLTQTDLSSLANLAFTSPILIPNKALCTVPYSNKST